MHGRDRRALPREAPAPISVPAATMPMSSMNSISTPWNSWKYIASTAAMPACGDTAPITRPPSSSTAVRPATTSRTWCQRTPSRPLARARPSRMAGISIATTSATMMPSGACPARSANCWAAMKVTADTEPKCAAIAAASMRPSRSQRRAAR